MKRRIIAIALMATLGITSFIACNKKNIESGQDSTNASPISKTMTEGGTTDAASNPGNPFDNVGFDHNVTLQATRAVWSDPSSTVAADYSALVQYANSRGYPVTYSLDNLTTMVGNINADGSPGKSTYVSTIGLSQQAKSYASQIFNLTVGVETYSSYEAFKSAMIQLESAISANSAITSNERQRLLTGASVARHSVLYWARETSGYNSDPGTNDNPNGPVALSLWGNIRNWLHNHPIFTADLGGGIGGAAGGLVGALCGAAGASIVEWASQ